MDPLLLAGVNFLLAILSGGLVAVIAQRLAFRDARRLQERERKARDRTLRRALVAEARENVERIDEKGGTQFPRRVIRTAWEAAREMDFPPEVFAALSIAYSAGEELNSRIAITDAHFAATVPPAGEDFHRRHQDELSATARRFAKEAHAAFEHALSLLEPSA